MGGGGGGRSSKGLLGIVGNGGRADAGIGGGGKEDWDSLGAGGRLGRLPGWLGGCTEGEEPDGRFPGRAGGPLGELCWDERPDGGTGGGPALPGEGRPVTGSGGLFPAGLLGAGNLPVVGGIGPLTVLTDQKTKNMKTSFEYSTF